MQTMTRPLFNGVTMSLLESLTTTCRAIVLVTNPPNQVNYGRFDRFATTLGLERQATATSISELVISAKGKRNQMHLYRDHKTQSECLATFLAVRSSTLRTNAEPPGGVRRSSIADAEDVEHGGPGKNR
jgi:hypothetical protein